MKLLLARNELITEDVARDYCDAGIEEVSDSFCIYM